MSKIITVNNTILVSQSVRVGKYEKFGRILVQYFSEYSHLFSKRNIKFQFIMTKLFDVCVRYFHFEMLQQCYEQSIAWCS